MNRLQELDPVELRKQRDDLVTTVGIILVYCQTPSASGHDDIFLRRLQEELAPIIKECEGALARVEGNKL